MGCYYTLCHNTYAYSLLFYKVYINRENAVPPAEPPSLEELWKEMVVALWEALPPAERAKIDAEKKAA